MDRLLWGFLEHLVYHASSEHGTIVEIGWREHQAAHTLFAHPLFLHWKITLCIFHLCFLCLPFHPISHIDYGKREQKLTHSEA